MVSNNICRRRELGIAVGIAVIVLVVSVSEASAYISHDPWVIEEGYDFGWWAGPENFIGQSFHVSQTGTLVSATLRLSRGSSSSGIFDINIYEFSEDTNEASTKLASIAVDVASLPIGLSNVPSREFIFSDSVITLSPGKTYLLAIEPRPDFTWVVFSQGTNLYGEGQLYFHSAQGWQSYGGDDMEFGITSFVTSPIIPVTIDIKPGSFPNSINLGSKGTVPVAILSNATFDARTVNASTVVLSGATVKLKRNGSPMASIEDVNGDDLLDMVVHVQTEALNLTDTDTEAVLEGKTVGGMPIKGMDSVHIVPP